MSPLDCSPGFHFRFFLMILHVVMAILFLLTLVFHSGKVFPEGLSLGIEMIYIFVLTFSIIQCARGSRSIDSEDMELILWFVSHSGAIIALNWTIFLGLELSSEDRPSMIDHYRVFPNPLAALIAIITLHWVSSVIAYASHLLEEKRGWYHRPLRCLSCSTYPACRHYEIMPDGHVTARVVAVKHGSPPEMWAHNHKARGDNASPFVTVPLQPVRPSHDPRDRRPRTPPPIMTTWNQWYVTPGEAV